jgi:uncharacterized protein YbgA (DUF1722 family)/uncharacterized protein YbbK (DUF523 family)
LKTIADERPRVGISACLLGQEVRFDGGHKRDPFLTEVLATYVEFVRVCPEVEVGMGTPREPLQLVLARDGRVRMQTSQTGVDYTDSMMSWARERLGELAAINLSGYVLKKNSPSCGMDDVPIFARIGRRQQKGRGLFAHALMTQFPNLPVEDEGRLSDARLRENFIERIFAYQRLQKFFTGPWRRGGLVAFHTAHKMSLLSHSLVAYDVLGRLVASQTHRARLQREYEGVFMQAIAVPPTTRRHTNVLMHMTGHLKKLLEKDARHELLGCIDKYRRGLVPLSVPLSLLRQHVRILNVPYLAAQTYLEPHPDELLRRNHG